MQARVNVTHVIWDTETDDGDETGVYLPLSLPLILVDIDDKGGDMLDSVLDYLSDTYGFLAMDVQYDVLGYAAEVDESSHYSSWL